jgi:S1-C subfamily serine protease
MLNIIKTINISKLIEELGLDIDVALFKGEQIKSKTGVYVAEIDENTLCKDYFQKGDVIIEVNGEKISTLLDLRLQIYKYNSGDILNIKVIRDGEVVDVRYNMLKRQ